jgi:hypothetical protein
MKERGPGTGPGQARFHSSGLPRTKRGLVRDQTKLSPKGEFLWVALQCGMHRNPQPPHADLKMP